MDISKLNTRNLRPGELIDPKRQYVTKDGKYVTIAIVENGNNVYCWRVTIPGIGTNSYNKEGYVLITDTEHEWTLTKVVRKKNDIVVPLEIDEKIVDGGRYIARNGKKTACVLNKGDNSYYPFSVLFENGRYQSVTENGLAYRECTCGDDLIEKIVKSVPTKEKTISVSKYMNVSDNGDTQTCASLVVAKAQTNSNTFARKKIEFTVTKGEGL